MRCVPNLVGDLEREVRARSGSFGKHASPESPSSSDAARSPTLRKKSRCWSKLPLNTIIDGSPDSASTVGSPISTPTSGENESNISPSVCSSKPSTWMLSSPRFMPRFIASSDEAWTIIFVTGPLWETDKPKSRDVPRAAGRAGHKPTAWFQISCGAACSSSGSRCRRTDNHTRGGRLVARVGRAEHEYRILSEFSAVEATSPPAQVHGRDE